MTTAVIILEGTFSEETIDRVNEFLAYMETVEEVEKISHSIGGGGFINTKPKK